MPAKETEKDLLVDRGKTKRKSTLWAKCWKFSKKEGVINYTNFISWDPEISILRVLQLSVSSKEREMETISHLWEIGRTMRSSKGVILLHQKQTTAREKL